MVGCTPARHPSSRAQAVLSVADSLQGSAKFRAKNTLLAILGTGYYDLNNKVRLGPYASLFSYNVIEGNRSRMGFTTLPGFNKNTNVHGYLAYGFQDTRVKYGIGIRHIESLQPWRRTVAYVGSDYDAIVLNYEDTDEDNLFNSLLRKNVPFRKTLISQVRLSQDWQLAPSRYSELKLLYRNIDPSFDFQYPRKDYVSGQSSDSTCTICPWRKAALPCVLPGAKRPICMIMSARPTTVRCPSCTCNTPTVLKWPTPDFPITA